MELAPWKRNSACTEDGEKIVEEASTFEVKPVPQEIAEAPESDKLPWLRSKAALVNEEIANLAEDGIAGAKQRIEDGRPTAFTEHKRQKAVFSKMRPNQRALRELFCNEFLFDFNATRALMRCGYPWALADKEASHIFHEAGVQQRIKELMSSVDNLGVTRERIMAGLLQEATDRSGNGSAAARVASWKHLATMVGVAGTEKSEVAISGVMLVPEAGGGVDAWEGKATASQTKLRDDVRS